MLCAVRIIAGEHRGRRLVAPPGDDTRPMLDRVREALFATLGERLDGARVLDLFAGSGSLGLEALSRGALWVRAVERGALALTALEANVATLGLAERVEIRRADALAPRVWEPPPGLSSPWADVAFLDPPYPLLRARRGELLAAFARGLFEALLPTGVAVLHAPRHFLSARDFPAGFEAEERTYGTTSLWYIEPLGEPGS